MSICRLKELAALGIGLDMNTVIGNYTQTRIKKKNEGKAEEIMTRHLLKLTSKLPFKMWRKRETLDDVVMN